MTEILENSAVDTVEPTETVAEQGTEVVEADTTQVETEQVPESVSDDKELAKVQMRKNQLENQAKELEEATGMKLEDLLVTVRDTSTPVEQPQVDTNDIDLERFSELTDMVVKQKYGDKFARLETIDQAFAKLEAKEITSSLPSDYKEIESDMVEFLEANKEIAKLKNGAEIAYNFIKGKNIDKIAKSAVTDAEAKLNETEEVKKVAFVENAKHSAKEEKAASLKDIVNLDLKEYAALPKEVRDKILQASR